jgi:hypothetical protein
MKRLYNGYLTVKRKDVIMSYINIDFHILKKIIVNNKKIEQTLKKINLNCASIQEMQGENKALLEFIENNCETQTQEQLKEEIHE